MERNENGFFVNPGGSIDKGGTSATNREGCGKDIADILTPTPRNSCGGCGINFGEGRQLAMVYAPMQCFRMLYNHSDALMRGTLFEELDKPLGGVK